LNVLRGRRARKANADEYRIGAFRKRLDASQTMESQTELTRKK
jgi:hypothetical protein